jgi:hypothetical protein
VRFQTALNLLGFRRRVGLGALVPGSYAITIRTDFSLWRDVAVAQVQVAAELVSDAEQRFEITTGTSTLVAYEFMIDGHTAAFDSD